MKRTIVAGAAYFLLLFALGFVLGTVRVLLVEPRVGAVIATAAEAPVMLAAALVVCRWAIDRWRVPGAARLRLVMTMCFLALLLLFETLLGAALFGRSLSAQLAGLTTTAGLLGLAMQLIAAGLPLWIRRGEPERS